MVYVLGLKKIMSESPLGGSQLEKFNIGELVYWTEFCFDKDLSPPYEVFHGIILGFITEYKSGRGVLLADVLPVNNSVSIQIVITKLRRVKTN